jgi:glutamine cyclotransferase
MRSSGFLVVVCSIALLLTPRTASPQPPVYGYEIVNTYAHDPSAFTEGLEYTGGMVYESTGLYGSSTLRQVDQDLNYLRLPVSSRYPASYPARNPAR